MYNWNQQIYELQQIIFNQSEQVRLLEQKVKRLEQQIQDNSSPTIDKIEYHFDQLKIERLEGTLHIGLSPNELANIDDLAIPKLTKTTVHHQLDPNLTTSLNQFVNQEGPQMIRNLSEKYNKRIDHKLEGDMIHDILSQIPDRITFYEKEAKENHQIQSPEQLNHYIMDHVKKEVYISLQKFMEKFNNEKGD
ncbi:spore germination protein GerPC [Ornithinibacillus halotolerans]|uniref:Spore germination protein GerPC n=1 Tax=Ornithinibacillus halotolerans TaxID=1274357 RepID=A0A916RZC2_9BACI|nr:spore germination protein GerPC [Ornithinibacillus halotolerans]GGA73762.1 putative spore germination protein GerPC [Ornithinibacillus halotolerans]